MRTLKVKIKPAAVKNEIKGEMADGTLKIDISAPPEKGKANRELLEFLAKEGLGEKNKISIVSGKTNNKKIIKIKD